MNPARLMRLPCVVTPRQHDPDADPANDEYGNPIMHEGDPIDGTCWFEQVSRSAGAAEQSGVQNVATLELQLYLKPRGTRVVDDEPVSIEIPLTEHSSISIAGDDYEIDGPPWKVTHPRTGRHVYWQATIVRTT